VTGLHDTSPALRSIAGPGKLVVTRTQAINGVTCTLTCPVVRLWPGQDACGTRRRREPEATAINLPARRRVHAGMPWHGRGMARQADPRFGALIALIASHLSNPLPRANAANGVTGYDEATLLGSGPWRP
jgi:hypothetical protein